MKRLLAIAAVMALAAAKPEMYKETEDFEYQRSSTDEGTKAGFYGAQRGNMGGNYERAHNMDGLAQHQMSGAVRQVEGELGDAASQRTGSVFTSANSRGIYGSGRYDLSNLQGRNFQENVNHGASQSLSSQSAHNSDYRSQSSYDRHSAGQNSLTQDSRYTGYRGSNNYGQLHTGNLEAAENAHDSEARHAYNRQAASHSSGYYAQSAQESQIAYGNSDSNSNLYSSGAYRANPQSRLIVTTPVRVVGRPGSRVAIPVGVQTYDASHSASTLDQNAISSDAEILSNAGQAVTFKPTAHAKSYESSYNYRKQWEKHDVHPEVVVLSTPTENPYPSNSELYEDSQSLQSSNNLYRASRLNSQSARSSGAYSGYNANTKSSSSLAQSAAQSQQSSLSSDSHLNTYNHDAAASTNTLDDIDSKPKSYQSSYAYHKSWERQGDPYVITPVGGATAGQASQALTASNNQAYSSHQYGSQHRQSHQALHQGYVQGVDCDCDENGHIRVARSYNSDENQYYTYRQGQQYDVNQDQQTNDWQRMENLGQAPQDDLQDIGQQTQDKLEVLGVQTQKQQSRFEDLGQQTQQLGKLEDLGQHVQNLSENTEDLGQQSQKQWTSHEDVGQQVQSNWDFGGGQEIENRWDTFHVGDSNRGDISQKSEKLQNRRKSGQTYGSVPTLDEWDQHSQIQSFYDSKQVKNPWDTKLDSKQQNIIAEQELQTYQKAHKSTEDFNLYSQVNLDFPGMDDTNAREYQGQIEHNDIEKYDRNPEKNEDIGQTLWKMLESLSKNKTQHNSSKQASKQAGNGWEQTPNLQQSIRTIYMESDEELSIPTEPNLSDSIENNEITNFDNDDSTTARVNTRLIQQATDNSLSRGGLSIGNLWDIINNYNYLSLTGKAYFTTKTPIPHREIQHLYYPSINSKIKIPPRILKKPTPIKIIQTRIPSTQEFSKFMATVLDIGRPYTFAKKLTTTTKLPENTKNPFNKQSGSFFSNADYEIHRRFDSSYRNDNINAWLGGEPEQEAETEAYHEFVKGNKKIYSQTWEDFQALNSNEEDEIHNLKGTIDSAENTQPPNVISENFVLSLQRAIRKSQKNHSRPVRPHYRSLFEELLDNQPIKVHQSNLSNAKTNLTNSFNKTQKTQPTKLTHNTTNSEQREYKVDTNSQNHQELAKLHQVRSEKQSSQHLDFNDILRNKLANYNTALINETDDIPISDYLKHKLDKNSYKHRVLEVEANEKLHKIRSQKQNSQNLDYKNVLSNNLAQYNITSTNQTNDIPNSEDLKYKVDMNTQKHRVLGAEDIEKLPKVRSEKQTYHNLDFKDLLSNKLAKNNIASASQINDILNSEYLKYKVDMNTQKHRVLGTADIEKLSKERSQKQQNLDFKELLSNKTANDYTVLTKKGKNEKPDLPVKMCDVPNYLLDMLGQLKEIEVKHFKETGRHKPSLWKSIGNTFRNTKGGVIAWLQANKQRNPQYSCR